MMVRRLKSCRGAAALEFAIVVPVFLFLVFVIIDFGWYFFVQHTLQCATREGAKVGQRNAGSIVNTIKDEASGIVNPNDLDITFGPVTSPDYGDPPEGTQNPGNGQDFMRIITKYVYNILIPIPGIGTSFNIVSKISYRNEFF